MLPILFHPQVRDLAASCFGPNLIDDFTALSYPEINNCHIKLNETRIDWLKALDRNPAPLIRHLQSLTSTRLGHYFEALWIFLIESDPQLELISANTRVYENKITLGEFDIIYRDNSTESNYHLELAIKFYLYHYKSRSKHAFGKWIGPNCIDRFDLKLNRLLHHQIQLGNTGPGIETLSAFNIGTVSQEIAIKGQLFYPTTAANFPLALSEGDNSNLSHNHRRGLWMPLNQFIQLNETEKNWVYLDRKDWIDDTTNKDLKGMNHRETVNYLEIFLEKHQRPAMIQRHPAEDMLQRIFITPNEWPKDYQG